MECACSNKKLQLDCGTALWLLQRMDEETREQIVEMLTRVGMMAEDLSASGSDEIALRAIPGQP